VVRSTVQARTGDYDATLPHTADMHMWLRLAAAAAVGVLADEQAAYRRWPCRQHVQRLERRPPAARPAGAARRARGLPA
jgi:hypothetical protein